MNRNLLTPVLLILWVAGLVSCNNADKYTIAVPKDAAMVFHINAPSLASKLSWNEIKSTSWFSSLQKEADDSLAQKLMENPENSGINTQADMAIVMSRRGMGGYMVFQGSLKDAAAFEAFNKQLNKKATSSKEGDLTVLKGSKNDGGIVVWNDSRFMFIGSAPFMAMQNQMMSENPDNYHDMLSKTRLNADSLVVIAKELFALKGSNSLFEDKRFAGLMKEPGDMHFWVNSEQYMSGMMGGLLTMIPKLEKLTKGNVSGGTANFDNGKMTMDWKGWYNKELQAIYEKQKWNNVSADLLNRIPSENVIGIFSVYFPPQVLNDMFELVGVNGVVNEFLAKAGYSMEELVKASKGELLFAVTDLQVKQEKVTYPGMDGQEGYTYTRETPDMKFLLAASVNDKPAFEKMVGIIKEQVGAMPFTNMFPDFSTGMNDNWFAASNTREYVDKFLAGGNNKLPIAEKLAGHPVVLYVDINKIVQAIPVDPAEGGRAQMIKNESLKMWQDIIITGGEFKDGVGTAHMELNLVDKNTNSLKQLNQYIDTIAATFIGRRAF